RGDDKLDLVGIAKLLKLGVEVARFFARPRSLHVHHPAHARVDRRHIERPAGLERYAKAAVAQLAQELQAVALRQRLTSGHAHIARAKFTHALHDVGKGPPLAPVECVGGIAVLATQWTAGEPHKHGRHSDKLRLALQGKENLCELEPLWGIQCPSEGSFFRRSCASLAASEP